MKPARNAKALKLEAKNPGDVFALFAALNMMGYDDENNARGMSPARKRVRNALRHRDWSREYPHLKRAIKANHPWRLLNIILVKVKKNTPGASWRDQFVSNLREFSREPLVRQLWKVYKTYHEKEVRKLFPLFRKGTARLITFLSRRPQGLKKIVLIINHLDAYWSGYALGSGVGLGGEGKGIGYIVVGPGAKDSQGELIRHELLHILAPPLWLPPRLVTASRDYRRFAAMDYGSRRIINREYVIRSLSLLYRNEVLGQDISKDIRREEKNFPCIKEVLALVRKQKGRLWLSLPEAACGAMLSRRSTFSCSRRHNGRGTKYWGTCCLPAQRPVDL